MADGTPRGSSDVSLRAIVSIALKRRVGIAWVAAGVAALVGIATFVMPPAYEARSSVLVRFGREYVYQPEVGDERPSILQATEEVLNSELQILASSDVTREVVNRVTVQRLYPPLVGPWHLPLVGSWPFQMSAEEAQRKLEKKLSVEVVRKSSVILVSFTHREPQLAAEVVNLLVELYKEKHLRVFGGRSAEFVQAQLREYEQRLGDAERALEAFRQQNGVYSYDQQMSQLLRRRAELDASFRDAAISLRETQAKLATLNAELRTYVVDPNVRVTRNAVFDDVKKEAIRTEAIRRSDEARISELRELLSRMDDQIRELDTRERELASLKRSVVESEKNYQMYRTKYEEMRISTEMDQQKIGNVSVIQAAAVPSKPVRSRTLNLGIGLLLGLFSGILYAFLAEHFTQRLSSPEGAAQRLRLPVLATVEYFPDLDTGTKAPRRMLAAAETAGELPAIDVDDLPGAPSV